ncbi:MAG: class I SAM-dependent methyltransferase [Rhodospirillales bacterium]|nr:class I SAM-dependent methyltransferase [Rhodospirillales bacterium]
MDVLRWSEGLTEYLRSISLREDDILRSLRQETEKLPRASMLLAPEQGQFLALLVRLSGAKRILEVGTFTGYSSLCMARALPEDGNILCCDNSEEWTAIARHYWSEAGIAEKIDLRLGNAVDTLEGLLAEQGESVFDFAFIDADKPNYTNYYERSLRLLRSGGLVVVDNVFWRGAVADPDQTDEQTMAVRALNQLIHGDERVDISVVPIGDGMTLARKR